MSKVGLFFGSFNPVHIGHCIIANYMASQTDLDQVWFVVSPHNPFKQRKTLAKDYDRLHLVNLAIEYNQLLKASNVEFNLPKPSYTVDTLTYLKEQYPNHDFVMIMGGDNLASLPKWKNYEQILNHHQVYIYKRPQYELGDLAEHPKVKHFDAPLLDISATYIRQCIKKNLSIRYLVPEPVFEYLSSSNMYKN